MEEEQLTYQQFIEQIISERGQFGCGEIYHERHHIVPKCLGGSNEESNLIDLYAKEHFIAHRLLAKENPNIKGLQYAWWNMAYVKKEGQERYECTPEEFEEARIAASNNFSGENNPRWGIHLSEDTKQKLREANLGKHPSEETRQKMSESHSGEKSYWYGRKMSLESRRKMSASRKGKFSGKNSPKSKSVICIETGIVYYSMSEAQKSLGINRNCIRMCCKGELRTAGGYHWKYYTEEDVVQGS